MSGKISPWSHFSRTDGESGFWSNESFVVFHPFWLLSVDSSCSCILPCCFHIWLLPETLAACFQLCREVSKLPVQLQIDFEPILLCSRAGHCHSQMDLLLAVTTLRAGSSLTSQADFSWPASAGADRGRPHSVVVPLMPLWCSLLTHWSLVLISRGLRGSKLLCFSHITSNFPRRENDLILSRNSNSGSHLVYNKCQGLGEVLDFTEGRWPNALTSFREALLRVPLLGVPYFSWQWW